MPISHLRVAHKKETIFFHVQGLPDKNSDVHASLHSLKCKSCILVKLIYLCRSIELIETIELQNFMYWRRCEGVIVIVSRQELQFRSIIVLRRLACTSTSVGKSPRYYTISNKPSILILQLEDKLQYSYSLVFRWHFTLQFSQQGHFGHFWGEGRDALPDRLVA